MTDTKFNVQSRETVGKQVNSLRQKGLIPGVIYGKGTKNQNISIDAKELKKLYEDAGESTLIDLTVDESKPLKVMIKEIQREPVHDEPIHVDFREVRMDEKITAEVDLKFINEAPAVKELGGTLIKNFYELEIECLPGDLVSEIEVDLSALKTFDDSIRIKNLSVPESVRILQDQERTIAVVAPPMTEEEIAELEKAPEADVADVEVEEKGKAAPEDEGEEAKEGAEKESKEESKEKPKAEEKKE